MMIMKEEKVDNQTKNRIRRGRKKDRKRKKEKKREETTKMRLEKMIMMKVEQ